MSERRKEPKPYDEQQEQLEQSSMLPYDDPHAIPGEMEQYVPPPAEPQPLSVTVVPEMPEALKDEMDVIREELGALQEDIKALRQELDSMRDARETEQLLAALPPPTTVVDDAWAAVQDELRKKDRLYRSLCTWAQMQQGNTKGVLANLIDALAE